MKALFLKVWDSPLFTTWANRSTKSLRFLLVTPLLVTSFKAEEIAAWYLFTSLTFFGTIIHDRVTLTFNRMIAFAMAGAQDLSAIDREKFSRGDGNPHWPTVKRAYGTIGFLTLFTAVLAGLSGLVMGIYSLPSILVDFDSPERVWLSLFIVLGGQTASMCFSQYMVTIQGMGLVALSNRWSCLFSILSVAAGFVTLSLGGGIVALAVAMQSVSMLNIFRMKMLINFVHDGALRGVNSIALDKEVIKWAWPAFWRGLFSTIMNKGVLQIGSVVYARYGAVDAVAAYLFSFNMLRTISSFAEAPLISMGPMLSRKLAQGDKAGLRKMYFRKAQQSQWLFLAGAATIGISLPLGLNIIGSNTSFLSPTHWALLSGAFILQRYLFIGLRLPALGNKVIYVKETAIAGAISILAMVPAVIYLGFYGLIIAMYLPTQLLLHIGPFRKSAEMIQITTIQFMLKTGLIPILAYLGIQTLVANL